MLKGGGCAFREICRLGGKVLISRHCVKAEKVNTPHNLGEKQRAGK